ncbi:MAG: MATE family efflux transporter [Alphaproteobacteria bacterium]|nr:MATE family efflux transporter [Alphaproteobacteria bacterium]
MAADSPDASALTDRLRRGPYGRIWALSWPSILSNLTVPMLGAVDTAVMGHLPDPAYVGGVAVGAMVFSFLYWGFGFLRMGTMGFVAQALGREDGDEIRAILARALMIGLAAAAVLMLAQVPLRILALAILDAAPTVEAFAGAYFDTRIWGAPATLANYAVLGWLLAMQYARAALLTQIVVNGINAALDIWFVVELGMGVEGVALATVIAQYSGASLGLAIIAMRLRTIPGGWSWAQIGKLSELAALFRVSRDIFLRTLAMIFAWSLLTWTGAKLGTTVLAANALLMNFQSFLAHGLDGFAHATSALVGEAVGARNRRLLRDTVAAATFMAACVALGYTAVYGLFGGQLLGLLTDIPELRAFAGDYLIWMALSPLLSVWAYQLDGIFIGATRATEMRNAMLASVAIYAAAMFSLPGFLGNHGLWAAVMLFMVVRALTLVVFYPRVERMLSESPQSADTSI